MATITKDLEGQDPSRDKSQTAIRGLGFPSCMPLSMPSILSKENCMEKCVVGSPNFSSVSKQGAAERSWQ